MSTPDSPLKVLQTDTDRTSDRIVDMTSSPTKVFVRLIFLRIGEIDTLHEKCQAHLSIEARWVVDFRKLLPELSPEDETRLNKGKAVSLIKYTEMHWHRQLYIENALGDLKGVFWEKLERKRSILTVTCHAARQSNYFYWNGYCLIFLITGVAFCIYGIPPHLAANRIQIACTLLLTSITFRWTVNRSLPTISYLTTIDRYAIMCIFSLTIHRILHGIIGAVIFLKTPDNSVIPTDFLNLLDQIVFFVFLGFFFIVIHVFLFVWIRFVPLKHRRNMEKKDVEYRSMLSGKAKRTNGQGKEESQMKEGPSFSQLPLEP